MKQRNSLVSNSSSTNFIVAYKAGEKCPCCGRGGIELADKIENSNNHHENGIRSRGIVEVIGLVKNWCYDETTLKVLKQLEEIPKDWEVIYFSISNHDDEMFEEINAVEQTGGKIIYRSEE